MIREGTDLSRSPILVTGGAGYIGSHVVLACQDAGYTVVVLDNFSNGCRRSISEGAFVVEANIADFNTVRGIISDYGITSVIHLAASIDIPQSTKRPMDYYGNNTVNSLHLLRACIYTNVRNLVFSSTAAVYGNPSQNPIQEEADTSPSSPYGRSKLSTEWMIRDAASTYNFNYVIFRFFNVAGADPNGRAGPLGQGDNHLIRVASEAAVGKRASVTVFGTDHCTRDGSCIRDYVHVSDIADAHVAALKLMASESNGIHNMVLNCGYGSGISVFEVLEILSDESPKSFEIIEGPRRTGDPPIIVAETSRIRECLGWSPHHGDIRAIIRSAIAWEQAH